MRKWTALLLVLALLVGLTGCGAKQTNNGFSVVTTVYPVYDWVRTLLGDQAGQVQLTQLLDSGVDLHSYQPTADDMVTIANCDLFVYVGGHSDEWVEDVLAQVNHENMIVIDLMEVLCEHTGMQQDEHDHEGEHDHEHTADEHIWLSLLHAQTLCRSICDGLCAMDSAHAERYKSNTDTYCKQLEELHLRYTDTVDQAQTKTLLFADRFPFHYLAEDYGLETYAAFSGCSAESEASFETIAFLASRVSELNLQAVITLEGSDDTIAKTVLETAGADHARILKLDSMQSMAAGTVPEGTTYLSVMEHNLSVLAEALQ